MAGKGRRSGDVVVDGGVCVTVFITFSIRFTPLCRPSFMGGTVTAAVV